MTPEIVKEMLELPILGMIPEDITLQQALSQKDAVVHTHPKSNPARAYKEIAAKITGAVAGRAAKCRLSRFFRLGSTYTKSYLFR